MNRAGQRSSHLREADGKGADGDCLESEFGLLGRHFGVRPRLYFNFGAVGASVGSPRRGRTQAENQEMSIVPGGNSFSRAYCVGRRNRTQPSQMLASNIKNWPVPRDLHEVRSFVVLCSYYRRHIQGFTELAAPLYELATKGTDFEWTARRDEACEQLKTALTSASVGIPERRRPMVYGNGHQ